MSGRLYMCIITVPEMHQHLQVSVLPYNFWDKQPQVEFWSSLTNLYYSFPQYCFPISFFPTFSFYVDWRMDLTLSFVFFCDSHLFFKLFFFHRGLLFSAPSLISKPKSCSNAFFSERYRVLSLWWPLYLLLVTVACLNLSHIKESVSLPVSKNDISSFILPTAS